MFKRFSTNYMVLLFLLDMAFIQIALSVAVSLRFILPIGQSLLPEWAPSFVYTPTPVLLVGVGIIWATSFLLGSVYTPRKVIFWFEEFQRVIFYHTVAALSLAGLLYMAKKELPRLTFVYFFVIALFILLSFRAMLRGWHRIRRNANQSSTRDFAGRRRQSWLRSDCPISETTLVGL